MQHSHALKIQMHVLCEWLVRHISLIVRQPCLESVEQLFFSLYPTDQIPIDVMAPIRDQILHSALPIEVAEQAHIKSLVLHIEGARTLQKWVPPSVAPNLRVLAPDIDQYRVLHERQGPQSSVQRDP